MADPTVRGRFVWHELVTPNATGAHEFYAEAVGWKAQAFEHDNAYRMFAAPSGPIGAAVESRVGTPQWVPYIGTLDLAATATEATRLGGRVQTPPTALPNAGGYAVLTDPQGATFGIHAPDGRTRPEPPVRPGEFGWHELATNAAPGAAFAFYAALFGWDEMAQHDMGPMGTYWVFGRNGTQLGGMFNKGSQGKPGAAYWLGYVSVTDLEGAVERAKAARGSVLAGPMDVPGGDRIAQLMDPHGAFFALHMAAVQTAPATGEAQPGKKTAGKKARKAPKKAATKAAKKPAAPTRPTRAKRQPAKKTAAAPKRPATRKAGKKKPSPARKPAKAKTKTKTKTKKRAR